MLHVPIHIHKLLADLSVEPSKVQSHPGYNITTSRLTSVSGNRMGTNSTQATTLPLSLVKKTTGQNTDPFWPSKYSMSYC